MKGGMELKDHAFRFLVQLLKRSSAMDNREKQPMDLSYKEALQELEQAMKLIDREIARLEEMGEERFNELQARRRQQIREQYPGGWIILYHLIRYFNLIEAILYWSWVSLRSKFVMARLKFILYTARVEHYLARMRDHLRR